MKHELVIKGKTKVVLAILFMGYGFASCVGWVCSVIF